jgi:hypothetical protein
MPRNQKNSQVREDEAVDRDDDDDAPRVDDVEPDEQQPMKIDVHYNDYLVDDDGIIDDIDLDDLAAMEGPDA